MYCGNNKTALASQRQIADALFALMNEQPYGSITVSAVCKRADVSRQTYYSLFQSKDNVITFALRNDCCYSAAQEPACPLSFREMCGKFSRYIIQHADMLEVLSRHALMPLFHAVLREDFSACLTLAGACGEKLKPYVNDFLAAGIASAAETYVRSGKNANAQELEEIIYCLLRGEYYP